MKFRAKYEIEVAGRERLGTRLKLPIIDSGNSLQRVDDARFPELGAGCMTLLRVH